MPFFAFSQPYEMRHQLHTGMGVSSIVIVEADDLVQAKVKLNGLGLRTEACTCHHDHCDDDEYWNFTLGYLADADKNKDKGTDTPVVYDHPISKDCGFPSIDEWGAVGWGAPRKYKKEGLPEGFLHYVDGTFVPFWQTTNERQDLDGRFGWGVQFNCFGAKVFMCTYNGYDVSGNNHAATGDDREQSNLHRVWVKPDKPTIKFGPNQAKSGVHGYGTAWFPTEEEANEFAEEFKLIKDAVKAEITKVSKRYKAPMSSIVKMWLA